MAGGGTTLEYTPTWIVALVCTVIVVISLVAERLIHYAGKVLKRKNQKSLFEALQKIKEELMLLGFISLLLAVFQTCIVKICVNETLVIGWLPCNINDLKKVSRFRILAESDGSDFCSNKGKVPLLSITAIHHLHIFIFVLAVSHVIFCVLTMGFGGLKIRSWKRWEDSISKTASEEGHKFTLVGDHGFIRQRYKGIGQNVFCLYVVPAFFKQFFASVTKTDYITLRLGFIMTHCKGNPKFNFHKYMIRAWEADFKKVVGISWYLWLFVVVFLSLNVYGWHSYFWISFVPLVLLLSVGTKLEHIITQLAREVADKHSAIEGELVVRPSDDHFWFRRPRLVLLLIHMILFQNSFEIAFFFMILVQYGFDSCIMGEVRFIIPRLVIGVFVQVMCSYSTLPLYAIVTQMGSSFKKAIFEQHIHEGLAGWANQAKLKKKGLNNPANNDEGDDALASASAYAPATPTPLVGGQSVNSGPYEIVAHQ